jgi:hypothetical protein
LQDLEKGWVGSGINGDEAEEPFVGGVSFPGLVFKVFIRAGLHLLPFQMHFRKLRSDN